MLIAKWNRSEQTIVENGRWFTNNSPSHYEQQSPDLIMAMDTHKMKKKLYRSLFVCLFANEM